jgi:hypothetical protein
MKRAYWMVVYVILSTVALVLASGAPAVFSGTGGG